MPHSRINDHENTVATRRRAVAFHLVTRIDQIIRLGDLGMLDYPPCGSRHHPWMRFIEEQHRLREIVTKDNPGRAELDELVSRTNCGNQRAREACRRIPANTQFSRVAHRHRQRMSSLARIAAEYAGLFPA